MSFILSSQNVYLDCDSQILRAECQREDGEWTTSEFNLNEVLGNIDGEFEWEASNFGESASDIRLDGDVLFANLRRADDSWNCDVEIRLGERIRNINGTLTFE